jgi:hypothetical protein
MMRPLKPNTTGIRSYWRPNYVRCWHAMPRGGAERDRCLSAENVEALQAANLFEVMMPHRRGG